jgi:hypothetical protein
MDHQNKKNVMMNEGGTDCLFNEHYSFLLLDWYREEINNLAKTIFFFN